MLVRKHPEVKLKGKCINLDDLKADPVVTFQRHYYHALVVIFWFIFSVSVPVYFWSETVTNAVLFCVFFRYVYSLHITWLTNSWCHRWGERLYDQKIAPAKPNAFIRHQLGGEAFHNFHHTFPWDYCTGEEGASVVFNPATAYINFFAWLGWAWGLKKARFEVIQKYKFKVSGNSFEKELFRNGNGFYEWSTGYVISLLPHLIFWCFAHCVEAIF